MIRDGQPVPVADLPLPDRVEIELDEGPDRPCMMYRFTDTGEFCGDTWHENLGKALAQSEYEYGLSERDFARAADETHQCPGSQMSVTCKAQNPSPRKSSHVASNWDSGHQLARSTSA